jgi:hypothetical protein
MHLSRAFHSRKQNKQKNFTNRSSLLDPREKNGEEQAASLKIGE